MRGWVVAIRMGSAPLRALSADAPDEHAPRDLDIFSPLTLMWPLQRKARGHLCGCCSHTAVCVYRQKDRWLLIRSLPLTCGCAPHQARRLRADEPDDKPWCIFNQSGQQLTASDSTSNIIHSVCKTR